MAAPACTARQGVPGLVLLLFAVWLLGPASAAAQPQVLRIVGGLAGVNQYTRHEEPFWRQDLERLSGGRYRAEIAPFDRAGLRGVEMLGLVRQGSVPFGTVLLSLSSARDPELGLPDLPGMNPDMASLRRSVAAFRPSLESLLRERHGVELLALYTYPAQVVFCNRAWRSLDELRERRIRTSSAAQADLIEALGAKPVAAGFSEIVGNFRAGNIDCAITGTMSGNTIGLHELTTHVHTMAVSWGLSVFVANGAAWRALPDDLRALIRRELPRVEANVWEESNRETAQGIACNTGASGCVGGRPGRMIEVPPSAHDQARLRELFAATVLPRAMQRCGAPCAALWDRTLAATAGVSSGGR